MTGSEYIVATGRTPESVRKAMAKATRERVADMTDKADTDAEKRLAALLTELVKN